MDVILMALFLFGYMYIMYWIFQYIMKLTSTKTDEYVIILLPGWLITAATSTLTVFFLPNELPGKIYFKIIMFLSIVITVFILILLLIRLINKDIYKKISDYLKKTNSV